MDEKINNIQDEIIQEFSQLDDWLDKYEYLINLGKNLKSQDEKLKSEENSISGCQSKVWIKTELKNEKIHYVADSDSIIVKGMLSMLLRVLNDNYPEDIISADLYFIDKIGLKSNLSPTRVNGLMSILNQIKSSAKTVYDRDD
jgi:cysteine desulfuration protein SufE